MPKDQAKKTYGGWIFFALVLIAYVILGVTDPDAGRQAFDFFTHVMVQVLPVLVLVFVLLFLTNLFLEPKWIRRNLGSASGARGWLLAILGGILSLGPVYPWYAMLGEMQQKGMRSGLIAAFLYSRAVKLPLLPLMVYYFGIHYTLVLYLYLIVFSILSGIVIEKLLPKTPGVQGIK